MKPTRTARTALLLALAAALAPLVLAGPRQSDLTGYWSMTMPEFTDGLGEVRGERVVGGWIGERTVEEAGKLWWLPSRGDGQFMDPLPGGGWCDRRALWLDGSTRWNPRHGVPPESVQDAVNARDEELHFEFHRAGRDRLEGSATTWSVHWSGEALQDVRLLQRPTVFVRVGFTGSMAPAEEDGSVTIGRAFRPRLTPDRPFRYEGFLFRLRVGGDEVRVPGSATLAKVFRGEFAPDVGGFVGLGEYRFVAGELDGGRLEVVERGEDGEPLYRIRARHGDIVEASAGGGAWVQLGMVREAASTYPNEALVRLYERPELLRIDLPAPTRASLASHRALAPLLEGDRDPERGWELLVVRGADVAELFGSEPTITDLGAGARAGRPVEYVLLDSWAEGDFPWTRQVARRAAPDAELDKGAGLAIAAVPLPDQSAGTCRLSIDGVEFSWVLPLPTNSADVRLLRPVAAAAEHAVPEDPVDAIFREDCFVVEFTPRVPSRVRAVAFQLAVQRPGEEPRMLPDPAAPHELLTIQARPVEDGPPYTRYVSPRIYETAGEARGEDEPSGAVTVTLGAGARVTPVMVPAGELRQRQFPRVEVGDGSIALGGPWREALVRAARIAGAAVAPQNLSRAELGDLAAQPWDVVTSRPFVHFGGREIPLRVGDLAAMLLARDAFIERTEVQRDNVASVVEELRAGGDGAADAMFELWRDRATAPGSAIGALVVEIPARIAYTSERSLRGLPVHPIRTELRNVYDPAYIHSTYRVGYGGCPPRPDRIPVARRRAIRQGMAAYRDHIEFALERARGVVPVEGGAEVVDDPGELVDMACVGMQPVVDGLMQTLVRPVADASEPLGHRVEQDLVGRSFLGAVSSTGDVLRANEEIADRMDDLVELCLTSLTVSGMLLPVGLELTCVEQAVARGVTSHWRLVTGVVDATSFLQALSTTIPKDYRTNREIAFATGAYGVLGPERFVSARLRARPGFRTALDLAGGVGDLVGLGKEIAAIRAARDGAAEELLSALTGRTEDFLAMTRADRTRAVTMLVVLEGAERAGRTLSAAESAALRGGDRLLGDLASRADLPTRTPRWVAEECALTEARTLRASGDERFAVVPTDAARAGTITNGASGTATVGGGVPPAVRLVPGTRVGEFEVGRRLGCGASSVVHELHGDWEGHVLKVLHDADGGEAELARMLACEDLLPDGTVVPIVASGEIGGARYVVQRRVPDGAFLHEQYGAFDGDAIPTGGTARSRIVGVRGSDGTVGPLPREHAHAICRLYERIADEGLIWTDGHVGNLVLLEEGGEVVARIVDLDHVWRFGERFTEGPCGDLGMDWFLGLYGRMDPWFASRIQSMAGARLDLGVDVLGGEHMYPSARFFMLKMLENHGYINHVRGRGWVDGIMQVEHAEEVFPEIRSLVDPDLRELRHGWLRAAPRIDAVRSRGADSLAA